MGTYRRLLSLFDYTGQWATPFAENGWDVICWDIKLDEFMDINLLTDVETVLDLFDSVDGIIAAPPCTWFTNASAQYWPKYDLEGKTEQAVEFVRQVQRLVDLFKPTDPDYDDGFFWALENPVGRIGNVTGIGKPLVYFDPWEYAGYLKHTKKDIAELDRIREKNGIGVTNEEAAFVVAHNAYTKKTGLWGEFLVPTKKPIQSIKTCKQGSFTQRLGGKSAKTKELRSVTPMGFAYAFYEFQQLLYND